MNKIRYKTERGVISPSVSSAIVSDGEDPGQALVEDAFQTLGIDIYLTVGEVTMHAAAWEDPDHWAEDWAEKLEIPSADVADAVAALLADATSTD